MSKIKAIIFDLGGVILDIKPENTSYALNELGLSDESINSLLPTFTDFETGKMSPAVFRQLIKDHLNGPVSDEEVDQAWNSMLLGIPEERLMVLKQIKNSHLIYLLSNTNAIHMAHFFQYTDTTFGKGYFEALFEKVFLSHEIGMRKPDVNCYEYVLDRCQLKSSETVFIDDSPVNIEGALNVGINGIIAEKGLGNWVFDELKLRH